MYYNLLLHQLSGINRWVTSIDPLSLEDDVKPLNDLAKYLSNVFLCPMVHIWLSTDDAIKYHLIGNNVKAFWEELEKTKQDYTPFFDVDLSLEKKNDLFTVTPFAYPALALWKEAEKTNGLPPRGQFCKALFNPNIKMTQPWKETEAITTGVKRSRLC